MRFVRTVLILFASIGGTQIAPAQAVAPSTAGGAVDCRAALDAFGQRWAAAAYPAPAKAAQARVVGQHGYETSGAALGAMRTQWRIAVQECDAGLDVVARQRVADLESMWSEHTLHRSGAMCDSRAAEANSGPYSAIP